MGGQNRGPQMGGGYKGQNPRDARSQGPPVARQGGKPMGGPGGPQQMGQPNMPNQMMPGFPQQPQAQPTNMKDAYLMRCAPLVKGVVPANPFYKNQVGTELYPFVQQLKGPKAPKITGMLIDLQIPEIHNILQNFDHFVMRVEQADQLISQQMAAEPNQQ